MKMRLAVHVAMAGLVSVLVSDTLPVRAARADAATPRELTLIDDSGAQWQIPAGITRLSVLGVGGGGGGAPGLGNAAGGGGAGGLVFVEDYLKQYGAKPGDTIEVRVGMPGAIVSMAQGRRGNPGTNTVFGKIVALGGGGGGRGSDGLATSGGSAGGGLLDTTKALPAALQPAESGIAIGFGHAGGGEGGAGGGGAGGPGTPMGKGGGGIGLQGVPKEDYVDRTTGFVIREFDARNADHYKFLFRDLFGEGFGEDGWFAGGGAHNAPYHKDQGGKGGGSRQDALPHTGGGGGGSTHDYQGSDPGIGGSGVVIVGCQSADGSFKVQGWGHAQPNEFKLRLIKREPEYLLSEGKYEEALASLDKHRDLDQQPLSVQVGAARAYGLIYAAMGREEEALAKFKKANAMESGTKGSEGAPLPKS